MNLPRAMLQRGARRLARQSRGVRHLATDANSEFWARRGSNVSQPRFPCVEAIEQRQANLLFERNSLHASATATESRGPQPSTSQRRIPDDEASSAEDGGPEPTYTSHLSGYQTYRHEAPLDLDYGETLKRLDIAYETWGQLNEAKTNAILIHTGLSASSHAKSGPHNPAPGWWENFIGPNKAIDTNKFFVICTNVLGGCAGSTGPSSPSPDDGKPYGTRFPIISIFDMVRAQFLLIDSLGIDKLYASVGASMGGMQSIAAAHIEPSRVGRTVSISGTSRSSPSSIAMRHAQRSVLMADPNWNGGFYYDGIPPHSGMKLAREIATITYRSEAEWEQRFGRARRDLAPGASLSSSPVLCPDFLMETYLDHQGEQFCLRYDANSLLYISKAMDLFDMTQSNLDDIKARRNYAAAIRDSSSGPAETSVQPSQDPREAPSPASAVRSSKHISSLPGEAMSYIHDLRRGLSKNTQPTLVVGVQTDTLFPIGQQRELADCLRANGNSKVVFYELNQPWGHDTFLLDVLNVGGVLRGFLESEF